MSSQNERSIGCTSVDVADDKDLPDKSDSRSIKEIAASSALAVLCYFGGIAIGAINLFGIWLEMAFAMCCRALTPPYLLIRRGMRRFAVQNDIPVIEIKARIKELFEGGRASAKKSVFHFVKYWLLNALGFALRSVWSFVTNVDYIFPTAAAAAFVAVVVSMTQLDFGLAVEYNGEFIGYVADESVYNRADKQMQGRIVYEDYIPPADNVPTFQLVIIKPEQLTTVNELTNRLIMASGNEITEAYGLYVDNVFQGAITDEAIVLGLLDGILDKYRSGDPTETVEFVQNVEVRGGLYPTSSITTIDKVEANATRMVQQQRIYYAQRGDAPTLIAQRNNVPYSELKRLNPGIEQKLLIGQEVLLSQSVPYIGVKVAKEEVYEENIPFEIQRTTDPNRIQGTISVTQTGELGVREVRAKVSYVDGIEQDREILDTRTLKEPINEKVILGGKAVSSSQSQAAAGYSTTVSATSKTFIWPVAGGGTVTCGFYGYYGHTGMDIALRSGSDIRAAASGTVSLVRYSGINYGNHVMIDHGGGVQTLYAHNSAIYVVQGQWVEQGQTIAAMGRTGRTTGVHLHFEIRIGGRYMNPASYIGASPY